MAIVADSSSKCNLAEADDIATLARVPLRREIWNQGEVSSERREVRSGTWQGFV
jgi:hypothetical protein